MRNSLYFLVLSVIWMPLSLSAQEPIKNDSLDSKYREDQFYFGVTYNLLNNEASNIVQNGFSSGFHFGLIRDMPINKKRNFAIGLGLGYSGNSINQNLRISKDTSGNTVYEVVESGTFSKNKLALHMVEVPLEFRWRTSTAKDYRFWRIYSGIKLGYIFSSSSKYKGDLDNIKVTQLDNLNKLQYAFTLTAGYDKFNVHLYYALNTIFDTNAKIDNNELNASILKIGLMLYIL